MGNVLDLNLKIRLFKGRASKGIKGIQLVDKDKVISVSILDNSKIDSKTIIKIKKSKMVLINLFYLLRKMDMEKIILFRLQGNK